MEYKVNLGEESISAIADMIKEQKVKVESKSITENGTYTAPSGKAYSPVTVNVPNPSTGTLQITENGEGIDVRQYAAVDVNVSASSDFSTAEVTFINIAENPAQNPYVVYMGYDESGNLDYVNDQSVGVDSYTIEIPIPSGKSVIYYRESLVAGINTNIPAVTTGSIIVGADFNYITISGSGSISLAGLGYD